MTSTTRRARSAGTQAARSDTMAAVARAGLAANATVYLLIGVLALLVAFGNGHGEANQQGALQEIAQHTGGFVVLLVVGLGLAAYALWQFAIAAVGDPVEGGKAMVRVKGVGSGVSHTVLAVTAFTILFEGGAGSQDKKQSSFTSSVMKHDFGRWVVGLVGVVVIVVGLFLIYDGVKRNFDKHLESQRMSERTHTTVVAIGVAGSIARGVVVGMTGVLVLSAAISFDPQKSKGIDGALRTLRDTPLGPWLLVVVALGLVLFGVFRFCEARWRKVA